MNWEEILKNIQISSQKTSSRDYVLPDEDEDCRQWWEDLMDMLDELLEYISGRFKKSGYRGNVDSLSKAQQCEAKQKIIKVKLELSEDLVIEKSGINMTSGYIDLVQDLINYLTHF